MSDLVARLRDADTTRRIGESYADTHERRQRDRNEAAAEIERLRRLRWLRASLDGYIDTRRGILYRAGFAEEQTSKRAPPMVLPDRLLAHVRRWAAPGDSHVITYRGQAVGDIHKSWASTVKAAGLGPDVTPHTLKHTAISWMLWEGRSIWEVAEDTGTSVKTIEEVYGHHRRVESRLERQKRRPIWRISGAQP